MTATATRSRFAVEGAATALARRGPSQPLRYLLQHGLVRGAVLDYGCGRGADVRHLRRLGFMAAGWDPAHAPNEAALRREYDTVLCTYVLNVLSPAEAVSALAGALERVRPGGVLFLAVRRDVPVDGLFTGRGVQRRVELRTDLVTTTPGFALYRVRW